MKLNVLLLIVVVLVALLVGALTDSYPKGSFGGGGGGGWIANEGTIVLGPMFLHPEKRGPLDWIFGWIAGEIFGKTADPILDCAMGPDPCVPPNGVGGGGGGGIQPDPNPGGGGGWARKLNPWNWFQYEESHASH